MKLEVKLRHLGFSQLCCWGFRFSRLWRRVFGWHFEVS